MANKKVAGQAKKTRAPRAKAAPTPKANTAANTKTKVAPRSETQADTPAKKKSHRKLIIGIIVAVVVLVLCGIIAAVVVNVINQQRAEEEQRRIEAERIAKQQELELKINTCTKDTKKDMLGFISYCYEENEVEVPEEVLTKDKERVDRILAQAAYDICMADAKLRHEALWDLNDVDPQNGDFNDKMPTQFVEYIQKAYDQDVDECKTEYPLTGGYESGFRTYFEEELLGWAEPKSEKIAIFQVYNSDGLIPESINMRSDMEDAPESIAPIGKIAAMKFKQDHPELWY